MCTPIKSVSSLTLPQLSLWEISQFMDALLPTQAMFFLAGRNVTLWMMSCGALVKNPESYNDLALTVQRWVFANCWLTFVLNIFRLQLSHVIAFTAAELQPCLTAGFILVFAQQVLVEGFTVEDFLQRMLPTASSICRHSDIVHLRMVKEGLQCSRYVWFHPGLRPCGQPLPVQCKTCGCICL